MFFFHFMQPFLGGVQLFLLFLPGVLLVRASQELRKTEENHTLTLACRIVGILAVICGLLCALGLVF